MSDLILHNANVITMDPALPRAKRIAVRDGLIAEIDGEGNAGGLASVTPLVIDCQGRTVLPGFIDAHGHVQAYAEHLVSVDLSPREGVGAIHEIQERVGNNAQKRAPGAWIRGKGYDDFHLAEGRHPTRWDLDEAAPLHPVKLTHRSGHAHVLNSLAMQMVGIGMETGDPEGGLIDRDPATAEPTGILYGMGGYLAGRIPALGEAEMAEGISLASRTLLSYGITSVQDASQYNDPERWTQFEGWKAAGLFLPRLAAMMSDRGFDRSPGGYRSPLVDEAHLRSGGVKIVIQEATGKMYPRQEDLKKLVLAIHRAGFQAVFHAVEKEAIEAACSAVDYALRLCPRRDHRHRIEHCSICPPRLADRIAALGIAVVTQPPFIYYSGDRYLKTVPPVDQEHLYAMGTMRQRGLLVGASSDFPIADPHPLVGIYAAVTRRTETGDIVGSKEGVPPLEALRMYTSSAAAVNFEEEIKGAIRPGQVADFAVLSDDPLRVDPLRIRDIAVEMTILDGRVVYSRGDRFILT